MASSHFSTSLASILRDSAQSNQRLAASQEQLLSRLDGLLAKQSGGSDEATVRKIADKAVSARWKETKDLSDHVSLRTLSIEAEADKIKRALEDLTASLGKAESAIVRVSKRVESAEVGVEVLESEMARQMRNLFSDVDKVKTILEMVLDDQKDLRSSLGNCLVRVGKLESSRGPGVRTISREVASRVGQLMKDEAASDRDDDSGRGPTQPTPDDAAS